MQVGLGLGVATIDTLMTRGSVQRTDNPTDLAIEGDGFFIVKGGAADTFKFTRAGNFGIDRLGNLVTGGGLNVYGWQSYTKQPDGTYKFDTESPVEPINLYSDDVNKNKRMIAAKATTYAMFEGNLDASYAINTGAASGASSVTNVNNNKFTMPITVYDSLGNSYKISVAFRKTAVTGGATEWTWEVESGNGVTASGATGTILFDTEGQVIETSSVTPTITIIPASSVGSQNINVKLDFSRLTMYAADSSAKATNVDGYPAGSLVDFSIGSDGMITGIYSNGKQQPLGLIALAGFDNPAGLQKVGENMYLPTTNSGEFKKGVKAGSEGLGSLNPGTLEMSNVDLSKEFTEMIITQRGFQANSRIITTSDEMLQELVNLKR